MIQAYIEALRDLMEQYRKRAYSMEADALSWALSQAEKATGHEIKRTTGGAAMCCRCKQLLAERVTFCPHCGQRLLWKGRQ